MSDDGSYITKPTDPTAIVKLQDPTVIEQLLKEPLTVIAEVTAGLIASGNGFYAGAGVRLAQAALKARVFQQFAKEFKDLRDKGRIPDDFTEKKNGYSSWVELLTILDEEPTDEDRLEALKAMFFAVNKVDVDDGQRIVNYQLFQIAKRLTSGELLLLKAVKKASENGVFNPGDSRAALELWAGKITGQMGGYSLIALVLTNAEGLEREGLLNVKEAEQGRPTIGGAGNYIVNTNNARLTDLGKRFCENIRDYYLEVSG